MEHLLAARSQMALSLGFHIVFAAVGIALPLFMVIAELMWMRTKSPVWLELAHRWGKITAVLFAVGAVSGTVLSFELGLLWPRFMEFAGPIVGMPFSLEGYAFFLEAIFLGVYLYGWGRVGKVAHVLSGVGVLFSGVLSGLFVVAANGWMNAPTGFDLGPNGEVVAVRPFEAMFNAAALPQGAHMICAAFAAVGFVVASVHARALLRAPDDELHRKGLGLAMLIGGIFALAMPMSGHFLADHVAHHQPAKLAAMEGLHETTSGAGMRFFSYPDEEAGREVGGFEVPYALSMMLYMDPFAEVEGLEETPVDERPPLLPVRIAYQIMIFCGVAMIALSVSHLVLTLLRRRLPTWRPYLVLTLLAGPLGMIAIEAGWTVTEVGRQPYIIYGLMKTADAVTPMPSLQGTFLTFTGVYILLSVVVLFLVRRLVLAPTSAQAAAASASEDTPRVA